MFSGTVVSINDTPSTSELYFVVTSGTVHRGQFVEIEHSSGKMLCLVLDVIKTNRYFERADSVKEFEAKGYKLFEQFPVSEWEYTIARAKPLGVITNSIITRATTPVAPGSKVSIASKETLERFYKFDKNGLFLGKIEHHNVDVKLSMNKLLKKHLAILSISGAGKSYAASCLIEELLDRPKELGRIACVVIDPHGEYTSFAEPASNGFADYSSKTMLVKGKDIRIGVPNLDVRAIASIIPGITSAQRRELARIIDNLRKEMRANSEPFDLEALSEAVEKDPKIKANTKSALLSWLNDLKALKLFAKFDMPSVRDLVVPGKLAVIELSDIIDIRKKQIIVSYFARKMFTERRAERIAPFLLIIEEAHQFVPEKAAESEAISRDIIRTIAREGRKFGACLCLISQRPVQLDTTALSQCNTKMILRITNPYDLDHIAKSAEAIDKRSMDMITSLQVGEALLVGEATGFPLFFRVRKRKSMPSKHEISLEEYARKFEESIERHESEAEAFL